MNKIIIIIILSLFIIPVHAGELWRKKQLVQDYQYYECDAICRWVRDLKRPDWPNGSCCGEGDRFEADYFERSGDDYLVTITDGKGEVPNGTIIRVPYSKLKWDQGNPTGRGQIFLAGDRMTILCYVPGFGL